MSSVFLYKCTQSLSITSPQHFHRDHKHWQLQKTFCYKKLILDKTSCPKPGLNHTHITFTSKIRFNLNVSSWNRSFLCLLFSMSLVSPLLLFGEKELGSPSGKGSPSHFSTEIQQKGVVFLFLVLFHHHETIWAPSSDLCLWAFHHDKF